jgi:hypothetical protein
VARSPSQGSESTSINAIQLIQSALSDSVVRFGLPPAITDKVIAPLLLHSSQH